ncbi:helix-turn-helix domain-containing protein [Evansella clarkii]|uniref:helix-turn-helix domain-containing protein n=1 Tax=Evansella clarkii TaxID=79879 RepID=UPI000997C902|nr:helix-turn-helix transcriptional regulator [Evansella clarkii]
MAEADSRLIEWLLHDSGVSRYKISKDVGISESTLSRIAKGETPMDVVRFGYARKLTEYARSIQSPPISTETMTTTLNKQSEPKGGGET